MDRSTSENNLRPEQPSRFSRRQRHLPPIHHMDINSTGPSIQDTNTDYNSSVYNSSGFTVHQQQPNMTPTPHVARYNIPHVSTASSSQLSSNRHDDAAISINLLGTNPTIPNHQNQAVPHVSTASTSQYSQRSTPSNAETIYFSTENNTSSHNTYPEFIYNNMDPESLLPVDDSTANMSEKRCFKNNNAYATYPRFVTNDNDSSASSITQSNPQYHNMHIQQYEQNLQYMHQQLETMKQAHAQSEENNRALLTQIIKSQQEMSNAFATVTQLQAQNQSLSQQINQGVQNQSNEDQYKFNDTLITILQKQQETTDMSTSTNTKFPKFSGSSKELFKPWYDQVLAILASPAWIKVFKDVKTKELKTDQEIPESLSSKLYASLRTSVTGNAEKLMMTKTETWGKGLLFLQILRKSYKVHLRRADLLKKEKDYSLLFQTKEESIDDFAARCIESRNLLKEHNVHTTDEGLRDRFLMGLGPLFTEIQQTPFEDLPARWQTNDMQSLINISISYRDEKLAVRERNRLFREANKPPEPTPKADVQPQQKAKSNKKQPVPQSQTQHNTPAQENKNEPSWSEKNSARQAKIEASIKSGTYDPMTYVWEVRPRCCIWHNSNTHPTQRCGNINRLLSQHPNQQNYSIPLSIRNRNNRDSTTSDDTTVPSARHVTPSTTSDDVPKLDNNPFADLCEEYNEYDEVDGNTSNTIVENYFVACKSVKSNSLNNTNSNHNSTDNNITFIVDSGAYPHMIVNKHHFTKLHPWENQDVTHVILADGTTKAKIEGSGTIQLTFGKDKQIIHNVLYVPTLSDNLFSAKKHQEQKGNYIHMENNQVTIAFPTFIHTSNIALDEPKFTAQTQQTPWISKPKPRQPHIGIKRLSNYAKMPFRSTKGSAGLDLFASQDSIIPPGTRAKIKTDIAIQLPPNTYGRIAPRSGLSMNDNIDIAAGVVDNDYRGEVIPCLINNGTKTFVVKKYDKIAQIVPTHYSSLDIYELQILSDTRRGHGGFGSTDSKPKAKHTKKEPEQPKSNTFTSLMKTSHKVCIQLPWNDNFEKGTLTKHQNGFEFKSLDSPENIAHIIPTSVIKELAAKDKILIGHNHLIKKKNPKQLPTLVTSPPPMRTVDKPLSTSTANASYSVDQIRKGFGFKNVNSFLNELKTTSKKFSISTEDREPVLDIGEAATMDKPRRNTTPLPLPTSCGDIVHMDIVFGSGQSIKGYKYALFFVDRATRHKYVYPMKDLKKDIIPSIKSFIKDIGTQISILRTDFDAKLIGKQVQDFFLDCKTRLETASPDEQNQNGLCERNWRSILRMARSWLTSALLPSEFWWYAIKRAVEVSNYVPIKIDNKLTTPHEQVYHQKVDLRNLFPLFAVAYPRYKHKSSLDTQSCRAILVGRSNHTHSLEFYHPTTKRIITTSTYQLDETLIAGPVFNLPYDGGLYFNKYTEYNDITRPPQFTPETTVYIKQQNDYILAEIISIPKLQDSIYTVQYEDGSIHQIHEKFILDHDPTANPTQNDNILNTFPPWIKNNAKCTLYLPHMSAPSQGTLMINNGTWQFRPGHKHHKQPISLPNLDQNVRHLIAKFQLMKGHVPFRKVYQAQSSISLSSAVASHVSAKSLSSTDAPNLIKHCELNANDKRIWNLAYEEEYKGLRDLPAWVTISEQEYIENKNIYGSLLPTMAISTVKYDEDGKPKRAKYRIVALGNLDPHNWSKPDCYAPVMSMLEVRFMTSLAVKHKCTLKSGDFKQAFVQANLPAEEKYVLKPPPGCYLTPKNTYWLLRRSIYGLKRAPRHWYHKAINILKSIGLQPCENAPCIFKGVILENEPPIYLGLYVDDFIFFSTSAKVEKAFQTKLKESTSVDFMGEVSHFLGLKFQWRKSKTRVKVHISQEAFADTLIQQAGLSHLSTSTNKTPYRSGYPVDKIPPDPTLTTAQQQAIQAQYRSLIGSLLWISQSTRPDLSTITNILAQHQGHPTDKHIASAKYAIKYLKGTKSKGIIFDSDQQAQLSSFVHFPIHHDKLTGISDANWGPQDQSVPKENETKQELELFKTRSISGHVIMLQGPLHWSSKRQRITARSSCEAEIYATDECVKDILHIRHIIQDLELEQMLLHDKTKIFNDNMACVLWSKNTTTKGLRHLQIRENAIRENKKSIEILHICGKVNPADMFSKEDKDPEHFIRLRDTITKNQFPQEPNNNEIVVETEAKSIHLPSSNHDLISKDKATVHTTKHANSKQRHLSSNHKSVTFDLTKNKTYGIPSNKKTLTFSEIVSKINSTSGKFLKTTFPNYTSPKPKIQHNKSSNSNIHKK